MSATSEKISSTEDRRTTTLPRPKRAGQRGVETTDGNETLWQRFDWRELNLVSTPSTLRHWHD